MCIAIVQKAGREISKQHLTSSYLGNPDGAGFAFIKDGKVAISKGYFTLEGFLRTYNTLHDQYGKDNPMLIHCRIATAGTISKDNCHPFSIKGGALIHNGHLWSPDGGLSAKKSDTREFSEVFYNILNYDDVRSAVADGSFCDAIGSDRMAMLYDSGKFVTAGSWHEEDTAYFSHGGYRYHGSTRWGPLASDEDEWNYLNCQA